MEDHYARMEERLATLEARVEEMGVRATPAREAPVRDKAVNPECVAAIARLLECDARSIEEPRYFNEHCVVGKFKGSTPYGCKRSFKITRLRFVVQQYPNIIVHEISTPEPLREALFPTTANKSRPLPSNVENHFDAKSSSDSSSSFTD